MSDKLSVYRIKIELLVPARNKDEALDNANNELDDIMMGGGFVGEDIEVTDIGMTPDAELLKKFNEFDDRNKELDGDELSYEEATGGVLDG